MRTYKFLGVFLLVPALAMFTAVSGCKKDKDGGGGGAGGGAADKKGGDDAKAKAKGSAKTPLEAKDYDGVLKGKVTLKGTAPTPVTIDMSKSEDKSKCLAGPASEKVDPTWVIDKDTSGVANVVVYLKIPSKNYFQIPAKALERVEKKVSLEQPYCAFEPHIVTLFPAYYDGKAMKNTGQVFAVVNNSKSIVHNTKWQGNPLYNSSGNQNLPIGERIQVPVKPQSEPLNVGCDRHAWMSAKIWAFDHPFFAKTDAKGNYTISNVPTGVEVTVVFWHEARGNFASPKLTFMKGDNTHDETISTN
jgi:hypothetical protein